MGERRQFRSGTATLPFHPPLRRQTECVERGHPSTARRKDSASSLPEDLTSDLLENWKLLGTRRVNDKFADTRFHVDTNHFLEGIHRTPDIGWHERGPNIQRPSNGGRVTANRHTVLVQDGVPLRNLVGLSVRIPTVRILRDDAQHSSTVRSQRKRRTWLLDRRRSCRCV